MCNLKPIKNNTRNSKGTLQTQSYLQTTILRDYHCELAAKLGKDTRVIYHWGSYLCFSLVSWPSLSQEVDISRGSNFKVSSCSLFPHYILGSALSKQGIKEARRTKLHLNINNYNSHKNYLRNSQLAQKSLTKRCHGWHQAARWTESCVSTTSHVYTHVVWEKRCRPHIW